METMNERRRRRNLYRGGSPLQVIRVAEGVMHAGGYCLADHEGQILPGQVTTIITETDALTRITVDFIVDGEDIVLGDGVPLERKGTLSEAAAAWNKLSRADMLRFTAMHDLEPSPRLRRIWGLDPKPDPLNVELKADLSSVLAALGPAV